MAFPLTPVPSPESFFEPAPGEMLQARSLGGELVTRSRFSGAQRGTFNLIYRAINKASVSPFFVEYWANPGTFAYTWPFDNSVHNVIFFGQPIRSVRDEGPDMFDLIIRLAKVP